MAGHHFLFVSDRGVSETGRSEGPFVSSRRPFRCACTHIEAGRRAAYNGGGPL